MPKEIINEAEFYYEIHGAGDPVVLIGGLKADHTEWFPFLRLNMQIGLHVDEVSHLEQEFSHSRKFLGVNNRVIFLNLVLCGLVFICSHIYCAVFLFLFIYLLALRLSIKDTDFQSWHMKSISKIPPVQNRWHL